MKLLRKLLGILPILVIGFTLLLAFVTFCLGLGKVIVYRYTDCLSGSSCYSATSYKSVYFDDYYVENNLWAGNMLSIFAFLLLGVSLVFTILNLFNRTARGSWLLLAGIFTFVAQFFFMARPIILVNIRTSEGIGDAFEAFNWITFGFSTLIWFNCIILFVLNKTLFRKVLAGEQPKQENKEEAKQVIAEQPKPVEEKADDGWYCPECGKHNVGAFCEDCGTKKPE
jgi:hypothetical protein